MINYTTGFFILFFILFLLLFIIVFYYILRFEIFKMKMPKFLNKVYEHNIKYKTIYWLILLITIVSLFSVERFTLTIIDTSSLDILNKVTVNYMFLLKEYTFNPLMILSLFIMSFTIFYIVYGMIKNKDLNIVYLFLLINNLIVDILFNQVIIFEKNKIKDKIIPGITSLSTGDTHYSFLVINLLLIVFIITSVIRYLIKLNLDKSIKNRNE